MISGGFGRMNRVPMKWGSFVAAPLSALVFFAGGASPLQAQSANMNFFVILETPGAGNFGAVIMADGFCHDQGYAAGYGDLTWRAYLTGTEADGEADQVARNRVGQGPWYNAVGVMIAENLDQLHSDQSNLGAGTALTLQGQPAPEGVLSLPPGSRLDGKDFSASGPLLCFGVR
jgi:hypothetical protein